MTQSEAEKAAREYRQEGDCPCDFCQKSRTADFLAGYRHDTPDAKPVPEHDSEPVSNCCQMPFTEPGWPDSDFCSRCHEHADAAWEDEDE